VVQKKGQNRRWKFDEIENDVDDDVDPEFKLGNGIQIFYFVKLNDEPQGGIPKIVEDSEEEDAHIDSLDSGDSEYDLDYKYNDEESDNDNTITQNEIDWYKG
jgi:hypothetical protein